MRKLKFYRCSGDGWTAQRRNDDGTTTPIAVVHAHDVARKVTLLDDGTPARLFRRTYEIETPNRKGRWRQLLGALLNGSNMVVVQKSVIDHTTGNWKNDGYAGAYMVQNVRVDDFTVSFAIVSAPIPIDVSAKA